jgi:hypothetical protein
MEQNRKPRQNPMQLQPSSFNKGAKICVGEKIASSTNGAGKTEYPPAED